MLNPFARRQGRRRRITLTDLPCQTGNGPAPNEPEQQVELICQAVEKLEQVQRLVQQLPELPLGDRGELLDQLGRTRESLRALYFLDAVY